MPDWASAARSSRKLRAQRSVHALQPGNRCARRKECCQQQRGKPKDRVTAATRGGQPPPVLTATMGGVSLGGDDEAGTLGSTATGCSGMGVVLASRAYGVMPQL